MDYNFKSKNLWRRWSWNRLTEKLDRHPSEAVGLYLVGPNDYDRKIATKKGFRSANLIAVDVVPTNVNKVRSAKNVAICEDICRLIYMWPSKPRLNFIMADFCCGLVNTIATFLQALQVSDGIDKGTVILLNLLRGRDPHSTNMRWAFKCLFDVGEKGAYRNIIHGNFKKLKKHRGLYAVFALVSCGVPMDEKGRMVDFQTYWPAFVSTLKECDVSYKSYKSSRGNMVMDSVAFKYPWQHSTFSDYLRPNVFSKIIKQRSAMKAKVDSEFPKIKYKISAAKAVRTGKIQ